MIKLALKSFSTGSLAIIRAAGAMLEKRQMKQIGDSLVFRITNRTRRGLDQNRRRFKWYSPAYAAQKGVARSAVDLKLTGQMLRGFRVTSHTSRSVKLEPTAGRKRAIFHQEGIGVPQRSWMGFSTEDRKFIRDELKLLVRSRIKRARRRR